MNFQKNSWLREKMESVERRQSRVKQKNFSIQFFYMMKQKIDTPDLGFWALFLPTFKLYLWNLRKKSWLREKMESVEKRQSSVIFKIFIIRFFEMMEQRIDTPNLGFWAL